MNRIAPATALSAVLCATLLLSACSNRKTEELPEGPLTKYFSQIEDSIDQQAVFGAKEHAAVENTVSECMSGQGFEYTPTKWYGDAEEDEVAAEETAPESGSLEFAKEYGFGIASYPGSDETYEDTVEFEEDEAAEDPNTAYIEKLPPAEREAYYLALHGLEDSSLFDTGDLEFADEAGDELLEAEETLDGTAVPGCYSEAASALGIDEDPYSAVYEDPAYQDLWDSLDEFWEHSEDPKVVATLDKEWQECMAGKGLADDATNGRDQVSDALYEEYEELTMGDEEEWVELTGKDAEEFTKREIKIAVPDAECAQSINYDVRVAESYNEQEQKFVDQHKAQLDALIAGLAKPTKTAK